MKKLDPASKGMTAPHHPSMESIKEEAALSRESEYSDTKKSRMNKKSKADLSDKTPTPTDRSQTRAKAVSKFTTA
jgi:hypothetical protein